ncbi:MAG: hypothetical protein ABGZ17_23505, partial [Planctomycetaceae bacterium]
GRFSLHSSQDTGPSSLWLTATVWVLNLVTCFWLSVRGAYLYAGVTLVLLVLCFITNWLQFRDIESRWPYVGLWSVGLGIWAGCFWNLRRRAGPITFVERQIAHVWAGSMIASTFLFGVEWALGMDVLELSPVLGLISGMVFLAKAGMLTGRFYVQAIALFVTAAVMAILPRPDGPNVGVLLFGVVSGACFFFPGLKYYRQRVGGGRSRS